MRIAIGSLLQETNTFSPRTTRRDDFIILSTSDLIVSHRTENSELHGFVDALEEVNAEIVPIVGGWAVTQGRICKGDFRGMVEGILQEISDAAPLDGVLFALHGAWAGEDIDSCDGYLLREIRQLVGPHVPIAITLDLHACVTREMWKAADILVGYKTCPHSDMQETGLAAGRLLVSTIKNQILPTMAISRIPMVVQADNMLSDRGELRRILEHAASMEGRPNVLSCSVFAVQPWLDVEELAWTAVVITDNDPSLAEVLAKQIAEFVWSQKDSFVVSLPCVDDAIDQAMQIEGGPVVLAEGADGTMGGGTGDATTVLTALIERNIDVPTAAFVVDPTAVEEAIRAGVGSTITVEVGGRLDKIFAKPVRLTCRIKLISDGEFQYKGRAYTGRTVKMGRAVVLSCGRISIVVSERTAPTTDPELFRSHGIEPKEMKLVLLKSPLQARLEYEPMAKAFISINSPGYCAPDLGTLPFVRRPQSLFPFDDVVFVPEASTRAFSRRSLGW